MTAAENTGSKVRFVEIGVNEEGQRLDNFLIRELKGVPKSRIYRILRKGEVRVNKKRSKPSDRLNSGDLVRIPPVRVSEPSNTASPSHGLRDALKNAVLFEDEALLIVNKPSGLAVHGGSGLSLGLIESLRAMRPDNEYLELVHRLDRETSGCLILARSRKSLVQMHEQMRAGNIRKEYLALARGKWPSRLSYVDAPLRKNQMASGERMVRVEQDGKPSMTYFDVVERYQEATLVRAKLETGRTHQIRVHAQFSGHPIAGDDKYGYMKGGDKDTKDYFKQKGLKRLFLHAALLEFKHPISSETVSIDASLPKDLQAVLEKLDS